MMGSRSLFQSAIKLQGQPGETGIKKSQPFLNNWSSDEAKAAPGPTKSKAEKDESAMASTSPFYGFEPLDKKGKPYPLSQFHNKVVLIVNVASQCGFTSQYSGLEALYKKIKSSHPDDFEIIGVPCNQFGGQEPGSDDDIQSFCQVNHGVTFTILGKTNVNGENATPLYKWLTHEMHGLLGIQKVKWNFEKFLVGKDGQVKQRWASVATPSSLEKSILEELEKGQRKAEL